MSRINQLLHRFLTENAEIIRASCHASRDKFPNRGGLSERLGKNSDSSRTDSMRRLESFQVDHSGEKLPTVSEAGIPGCLKACGLETACLQAPTTSSSYPAQGKPNTSSRSFPRMTTSVAARLIISSSTSGCSVAGSISGYAAIKTTARISAGFPATLHMRRRR